MFFRYGFRLRRYDKTHFGVFLYIFVHSAVGVMVVRIMFVCVCAGYDRAPKVGTERQHRGISPTQAYVCVCDRQTYRQTSNKRRAFLFLSHTRRRTNLY